ncbi:MAG: ATP-binding protein [Phycisphaerales bacterium JB061]
MTSEAPSIEIKLLSNPIYLAGARELILGLTERLGFKQDASGQIALAVDEALANIINHGYERQCDKPIWIQIWTTADGDQPGLRIHIEDEAKQIDPDSICGRDLDDVKPGGLGVHIIRQVMDTVVYEKKDCCGMRLKMSKKLQTDHNADQPEHSHG